MENKENNLKNRILDEMTVNYANTLEKNFDLAKQFVRITQNGKIDVIVKEKVIGKQQILLYLIGKLYAKEAGVVTSEGVPKEELMDELGLPEGSVFPWLKDLSDKRQIKKIKKGNRVHYAIMINVVEKILKEVEKKLSK